MTTTPSSAPQGGSTSPLETNPEAKQLAFVGHLLGITGIGPLIWYLIKKDEAAKHPWALEQMKEATNFHTTMAIASFVLSFACGIGVIVWVVQVILAILAAMKAKEGIAYHYFWKIAFVK